jgi:hypothetical protein
MGLSVVTTPGTVPGYVTLNYPGYTAQAVNLANTAGGTATRYITGTWAGATNFTVSGWFNPQSLTGVYQVIFSTYSNYCAILINPSNQLIAIVPSGGGLNYVNVGVSSTLVINTWYYFSLSFQTNGTCSFYLNNTLLGSITNTQGVASLTTSVFELSGYEGSQAVAFNGFMDDFRITNSVSAYVPIPLLQPNIWLPFENSAGDLGSHSLPPSATPAIYLPFEGNVTDSVGTSAPVATGAVTYVAANREGYTGQAIRLTNTAGGTATQYVRGSRSAVTSQTISFWFNMQTGSAAQYLYTAYYNGIVIGINTDNTVYLRLPANLEYSTTFIVSSAISTSTWYYVTAIVNIGGTCSFYLNNTLVGTYANTGFGDYGSSGSFGLGTTEQGTAFNAFNGLIDDFRMYNSAIPYVPVSVTTVTGSLSYVPGVVGLNAVNLVNTAGAGATNFIRGAWTGAPHITVSGWFNMSSFQTGISSGANVHLFFAYTGVFGVYCNPSQQIQYFIPSGGAGAGINIAASNKISLNTWYHIYCTFRTGGLCELYINGSLIGSATNTGGVGTLSTTQFAIGTLDHTVSGAFDGYVDDFRIYNAAIPIHVLFPQNYRSLALSGTGQYALASAASGWVVGSSDSSRTWSKQAVCVGTQSEFIQPQLTGLSQPSWEKNGIVWTSSVSSQLGGTPYSYHPFQNTNGGNIWISLGNYSSGVYNNTYSTTVQGGIGTVYGEWLQIQSSVPLVITSYTFQVYNSGNLPKSYYIVGSADGLTNWYPIQLSVLATNPITTTNVKCSNDLLVNFNGTQTLIGNVSSTVTTTAYTSTTTPYTHFRIIVTGLFSTATYAEIGEWYVNFVRPLTSSRPPTHALSLNHTGQYQMVATGPAAGSIMPNLTGLAASTWTQCGVNWGVSVSTELSGYFPHRLFDNTQNNSWANSLANYTSSGTTSVITTMIQGVGVTTGDWVQIQSSVPLVMASYQFGSGGGTNQLPKTYYIIGSNDGSTWFPIQYGLGGAVTSTAPYTIVPGTITVNSASTQTFGSSTITTTIFSTTTNAYTYFRLIGLSVYFPSGNAYLEIGEWLINFANSVSYSSNFGSTWLNTSSTVSNESVALSASGQYSLSTNSVAPFARLRLDGNNVDAQGVLAPTTGAGTVTYDTSIKAVGSHSAFFDNTAGAVPSVYLNYTVPTVLNRPSMLTMACWIYPIAYGLTVYPFGFYDNLDAVVFSLYSRSAQTGIQFTTSTGISYIETTTPIPLNTWSHITVVFLAGITTLYMNGVLITTTPTGPTPGTILAGSGSITKFVIGSRPPGDAFRGYVDDVRLYTSALNADEINGLFKNPALTQTVAVSSSYLPITGYSEPALPGITANIVDAAVSQTGQYMVAVTSSTTNNVYYSTDFGATFTALTVGSLAMVSCSISYDGSYLTVESATTVHTLNRNTRGFSVTVGNQAGLINQAQNAIAIGDKAGRTNQSANSIVLNATGAALDAVAPGFYVSPVATAASSSAAPFSLLGYGTDNQIVQSSALTVLQNGNIVANGNVGIGTALPGAKLSVIPVDGLQNHDLLSFVNTNGYGIYVNTSSINSRGNTLDWYSRDFNFASITTRPILTMRPEGNVGIGTMAPDAPLHVVGSGGAGNPLRLVSNTAGNEVAIGFYRNPDQTAPTTGDLWVAGIKSFGSGDRNFCIGCSGTNSILTMLANGNVGIGTTNPFYKLEVSRTIRIFAAQDATPTLAFNTNPASFSDAYITGEDNGSFGHNIGFYTSVNSASPVKRMTIFGNGNVSFTGTISKGGGTFDITHPLYISTNKRLVHSFIEGPRCDLIYRGKTTLINGSAVVDINKECTHSPECAMDEGTFEALCDNAECFLQNKTGFTRVIGVITGGILTITAESENATDIIVWMVIGERADPFIKQWDRTNPDGYLITQYTAENNTTEMSSE